jgi:hypothetical protein
MGDPLCPSHNIELITTYLRQIEVRRKNAPEGEQGPLVLTVP